MRARTLVLVALGTLLPVCGRGDSPPPAASLLATPSTASVGAMVRFDASRSIGNTLVSFEFFFGDGSAGEIRAEPTSHHAFSAPGAYRAEVVVTDEDGRLGRADAWVTIAPPYANLDAGLPDTRSTDAAVADSRIADSRIADSRIADSRPVDSTAPDAQPPDSPACAIGLAACGGGASVYCANLRVDPGNCGACGKTCAASEACSAGLCVVPCHYGVAAFDVSPVSGNACNVNAALATDGNSAGLAYIEPLGMLGGQWVAGCVGVDFGTVVSLDPVMIRASSTSGVCGGGCSSGYCGTGDSFYVFRATSAGSYTYVTTVGVTPTLADYAVTLGAPARYVAVCRTGAGPARDDILVDSARGNRCP